MDVSYFLQQLVNGLALGTTYALIALGFVLVFGVMKVFNAALGGLVVIGAYSAWWATSHSSSNLLVAVLSAVVVTVIIGAIVEQVAIAPVIHRNQLASFLTTLGCAIFLEGLLRTLFTAQPQAFRVDFPSKVLHLGEITVGMRQLTVIAISATLIITCDVVINRTGVGRKLRAVAENPLMASSLGINARWVRIGTVAAASTIAGITGVLLGVSYGSITPMMGVGLMLKGFVILSVGGMTSFRGAALVGVMLGIGEVMTTAYAPELPRDSVTYALLVLVMLIKPAGLFGRLAAIPTPARTA